MPTAGLARWVKRRLGRLAPGAGGGGTRPSEAAEVVGDVRIGRGEREGPLVGVEGAGAVVEYEIDTNAGTIVAVVADPDPAEILHEGDLVEVDFRPSRGWLLPA